MKAWLIVVAGALLSLFSSGCVTAPGDYSPAEIYELVSPAIVSVSTPHGTGSGVSVSGAWILTNAHVVWPFRTVEVRFPGASPATVNVAHVNLLSDLALLGPINDVPAIELVPSPLPDTGTNVYLVGYPADNVTNPVPSISAGIVSRTRRWETMELNYVQTDTAAAPGQSGGVLINESAQVVGLSGHVLGANDFTLSLWVNDVIDLIERMESGDTMAAVLNERGYAEVPSAVHETTLANEWDALELGLLGGETSVTLTAESELDLVVSLFNSFGQNLHYVDDTYGGRETLTASQLSGDEHVVVVSAWQPGAEVRLTSDVDLHRRKDPDDGRVIIPGDTITGVIDYGNDYDFHVLNLPRGSSVTISVESVMMDPYLSVDLVGDTWPVEDDDSGGDVLGTGSMLTVTSTTDEPLLVVVSDVYGFDSGGYIIRTEFVDGSVPGAIRYPSPEFEAEPFGEPGAPTVIEDPEDIGEWAFFSDRPTGWIEDTEFFAAAVGPAYAAAVQFGGGLPSVAGYDPSVLVMTFPVPRTANLESVVDSNIASLESGGNRVISRTEIDVYDQPAEQIELGFTGMYTTQTYLQIGTGIWMIQMTATTSAGRDSALDLLESFDPALTADAGTTEMDPREQLQMELGAAFAALDGDDVAGAIEVLLPFRDRAEATLGPDDDVTMFLQITIATGYLEELGEYEEALEILKTVVDNTPGDPDLRDMLASVLNQTAWEGREGPDGDTLLHFAERSVALSQTQDGEISSSVFARRHTLAMLRHYAGDTEMAITELESLVSAREETLGVDAGLVGYWLDLAHLYNLSGRTADADQLSARARESGIDPPDWALK